MYAFLFDEAFQCEARYYVLRAEKCIYRWFSGVYGIHDRIPVRNDRVLEDQGVERLEMDLLESDVSVKFFRQIFQDPVRNGGLNLRKLYDQHDSEGQSGCSYYCQPYYFYGSFYNSFYLEGPTCKNNKIFGENLYFCTRINA